MMFGGQKRGLDLPIDIPGWSERQTELEPLSFASWHASALNSEPWQTAPTGRRAIKFPLTVLFKLVHSACDGQHGSEGRQRQLLAVEVALMVTTKGKRSD